MAVSLTFDAEGCYRALIQKLIQIANSIMEEFYNDAILGLDVKGKEDSEKINAIWDETSEKITTECKFRANALMQSFGTGSLSDTSVDSYWNEYKNSGLFNPVRPGKEIVGRKRGSYINIFGEKDSSWGAFEGKNIEHDVVSHKGTEAVIIEPVQPKYSIQNAENWLIKNHKRRVEDRIKEEVKDFFENEARNFFVEINI